MTNQNDQISLRSAAVIAGLAIFIMVLCAPFAELYVMPKLFVPGNMGETVKNITDYKTLFVWAIVAYLITFICDLLAAWALFILLKPVNRHLSLLTAWFRLVYAIIAIVSLLHLVDTVRLVNNPNYLALLKPGELNAQVMLWFSSFKYEFHFGILFFGIHLGMLGYLVLISGYIPRLVGLLLIVSGLGYFVTALQPLLFPDVNIDFAKYTFYGELVFMLWLLIRGWKIKGRDQIALPSRG